MNRVCLWRLSRYVLLAVALVGGFASQGCDGTAKQASLAPPPSPPVMFDQPQQVLLDELALQGTSFAKKPAAAPTGEGSEVFDLIAMDYWDGDNYMVSLEWTEWCNGDYNLDGAVTVSDLTPLSIHWQEIVTYDDPQEHESNPWWPSGDPDSDNWRRAAVDGNRDGLIDVADVTAIGRHWQERLDGYQVFSRESAQPVFELMLNQSNPAISPSAPRDAALAAVPAESNPAQPLRYHFTAPLAKGEARSFYVRAFDADSGSMGSRSNIVVVNVPGNLHPNAKLDAEPASGDAGLTVNFDAAESSDADGEIAAYEWDFEGDGVIDLNSGSDPTAQHTYPDPGEYEATLCVTDNDGALAYDVVNISIANQSPQAVLQSDPAVSTRLVAVHFDASLSSDTDGQIVDYAWDFEGDAIYDEHTAEPTIDHLYGAIGDFEATVYVTDNSGGKATASSLVTIENIPPVLKFKVTPDDPEAGHHITIDLGDSYDPDGEITRYKWDYGTEVSYKTTPVATKVFDQAGEYSFGLEIKDDNGALVTGESEVYVTGLSITRIEAFMWGYYPYLGIVNGLPAVTVYRNSYPHYALQYAGAVDEIGSDWLDIVDVSLGEFGDRNDSTCAEVNGRPAILEGMSYFRALDASGTEWGEPIQLATGVENRLSAILVVDGRPLTMFLKNTRDLAVIKADDVDGQSWSTPYILDLPDEVSDFSRMVPMGEEFAFTYTTNHEENLYFASVDFEAGAVITQNTLIDDTGDIRLAHESLAIIDDFPMACYRRGGDLIFSRSYRENQWYQYSYIYGTVLDSSVSQTAGLVEVAGCPAIAYQRSYAFYPLIYLHAKTPTGSQWKDPLILQQGLYYAESSPLRVVNGRAALAVYGRNEDLTESLKLYTVYE